MCVHLCVCLNLSEFKIVFQILIDEGYQEDNKQMESDEVSVWAHLFEANDIFS